MTRLMALCLAFTSAWAVAAQSLSLEVALDLAERSAPSLHAARASIEAAKYRIGPAGELPDPELLAGIDNLPANRADAGQLNADFMTMRKVGLVQRFVGREKRSLRRDQAIAETERVGAKFSSVQLSLRVAVARAWINVVLAERRQSLLESQRKRFDLAALAAEARLVGGVGNTVDALSTREARIALEDRISEAVRDCRIARLELARWLPGDAERPLSPLPDWRALGDGEVGTWLTRLDQHRELLGYAEQIREADVDLRLAEAEKKPDWSLELAYAQREPAFSNMLSLMVRVDLPVFSSRRQDPLIAAKRAERERIDSEREDARRRQRAALEQTIATWKAAKEQVARYEDEMRPLARDRSDAALAMYRGGRGDLSATIAALSAETERELDYVNRLGDLARAWAELRYSFAKDH